MTTGEIMYLAYPLLLDLCCVALFNVLSFIEHCAGFPIGLNGGRQTRLYLY